MTKRPEGWEFLKIAIPAELKRDVEDCLKLRGVTRFTSRFFKMLAEEFVEQTKAELAAGEVEQWADWE